jgi:stage V sporulation protein D (sporulation-specific penicillin-binding protein)
MVGNYIVSFMGFLPADNPEYVVYVAIDNPKGITQYGGTVAAPVAKNVMLSIIDYEQYPQVESDTTREYTWLDTKYIKLPDVSGMTLSEAKKLLKDFSVEYAGIGDTVIEQSPSGNTYVKEGSTVKLMLN